MTVAELIEKLKQVPQDATVMHYEIVQYGYAEDCEMRESDVRLVEGKVWV